MPDTLLPCVQHREFGGVQVGLRVQNCVVHTDSLEAAVVYEYLPAPQVVQTVLPVVAAYVPMSHAVHTDSLEATADVENFPAPQAVHEVSAVAPSEAEYLPAPQSVHEAAADSEYLPTPQVVQVVSAVAPSEADCLPAAHSAHVVLVNAAVYLPPPQSVHGVASVVGLNLPARHWLHQKLGRVSISDGKF